MRIITAEMVHLGEPFGAFTGTEERRLDDGLGAQGFGSSVYLMVPFWARGNGGRKRMFDLVWGAALCEMWKEWRLRREGLTNLGWRKSTTSSLHGNQSNLEWRYLQVCMYFFSKDGCDTGLVDGGKLGCTDWIAAHEITYWIRTPVFSVFLTTFPCFKAVAILLCTFRLL